jgi:hypothetical protein
MPPTHRRERDDDLPHRPGHRRSRNGDFEADKARYRGLASVALTPLTRPSEAMAMPRIRLSRLTAIGLLTAEAISRKLQRR